MLVLARQANIDDKNTIEIADGLIRVVVLGVDENKVVRLGIDAPKDIRVCRGEISHTQRIVKG